LCDACPSWERQAGRKEWLELVAPLAFAAVCLRSEISLDEVDLGAYSPLKFLD